MKKIFYILLLLSISAFAARVKDVATLDGLSNEQLIGYGLVVGLPGSGDGTRTAFTLQSVANMLKKLGIEVPQDQMKLRNVAAVMVTAELAPFTRPGKKIDVSISSLGDARSLEGGTLLMTPLQGSDGEYYVVAQGAVSVGGLDVQGKTSTKSRKGQPLGGSIPNGGIVKRDVGQTAFANPAELRWVLSQPDFSSAVAMAESINKLFPNSAVAEDASTVAVKVPKEAQKDLMAFVAKSENAAFVTGNVARVVMNERTGTLVSGSEVRISEVVVSHGSIIIQVDAQETASQPNALSQGQTASVINEQVAMKNAGEPKPEVKVIPAITNAGELAQALNSLGVAPQDIIIIFQAIKKAGALHAELVLM